MKIAIALTLLASLAFGATLSIAAPTLNKALPDTLYIYGTPNKTYQCEIYMAEFGTEGANYYFAERCSLVATDSKTLPTHAAQPIVAWLFLANQVPPNPPSIGFNCKFVSHQRLPNRRTKTDIDCR